jgi:hypothetical protein
MVIAVAPSTEFALIVSIGAKPLLLRVVLALATHRLVFLFLIRVDPCKSVVFVVLVSILVRPGTISIGVHRR